MKKPFLLALFIALAIAVMAQTKPTETFLQDQLQHYSKLHLLDIYKSCFQDYMGAEHLVVDKERAMAYLEHELTQCNTDTISPMMYEYCGVNGKHVRVSLLTIIKGFITKEELLDAFMRSANTHHRPPVSEWHKEWNKTLAVIEAADLNLPNFDADKTAIETMLEQGEYATSHSPDYRVAYHPHYRIVERGIFDKEILPRIRLNR